MRILLAMLILCLVAAAPARAVLLEDTPERVVFLGYPDSAKDWTVKVVRREASYGIYAYHTGSGGLRVLTRDRFLGVVEGSMKGVALDSRAQGFLARWLERHPRFRTQKPTTIGRFFRFQFEDEGWVLKVTTREPYRYSDRSPWPAGLVSLLFAQRAAVPRLEALSRAVDVAHLVIRDPLDLRRFGR